MHNCDIRNIINDIRRFLAPSTATILRDLERVEAKIENAIAKTEFEMDTIYSTMSALDDRIATLNRELGVQYKLLNSVNVVTGQQASQNG
jgi:hypothetical protein